MALSIKNPEVERLARELAAKTGESITDAVLLSLRERLIRQDARSCAWEMTSRRPISRCFRRAERAVSLVTIRSRGPTLRRGS